MKQLSRNFKFLALLVCIAGLAVSAGATGPIHLQGNLHNHGLLMKANSSMTLRVGGGVLHLTSGSMRTMTRRQGGAFLQVEGAHLNAGAHYLLLANGRPLTTLVAGDNGRVSERFSAGLKTKGFRSLDASAIRLLARSSARMQVVELGAGETRSGRLLHVKGGDDGHGDHGNGDNENWNMTPLCGDDPMLFGQVEVYAEGDMQEVAVWADGLDLSGEFTVVVDGVNLGSLNADFFGFSLIAGNGWDADIPLPEEITSVMDIVDIQILAADGTLVLHGNFENPCDDGGGGGGGDDWDVADSGYIEICDSQSEYGGGELDWLIFTDGSEAAYLFAGDATPGAQVGVVFDGTEVATVPADDWGGVFADFGTTGDGYPLPDAVLPLSDLQQVDLLEGTVVFASGVAGEECEYDDPVDIDDMEMMPLCSVGDTSEGYGMTGWAVWSDGVEEFWVEAQGLTADASYDLLVDGFNAGSYPANEGGEIWLYFSSEPEFGRRCGNGNDDFVILPLPEDISPVADMDAVSLLDAAGAGVAGSFSDPCDDVPEPPGLLDEDMTFLCPTEEDSFASGAAAWVVWDDGVEEFWVDAQDLESGAAYELMVDSVDLGSFVADEYGMIFLYFSSAEDGVARGHGDGDQGGYGDILPLPAEISPISGIDQVSFLDADAQGVAGSFVDGCDFPEPPGLDDEDMTDLCPIDADSQAWGQTAWAVWDDGVEEFWVYAAGLVAGQDYSLQVDSVDLGSFTADDDGDIGLYFSTDSEGRHHNGYGPSGEGMDFEILPLPEDISPVSGIDQVAFLMGDVAVVQGSFVDGCDLPDPADIETEDVTTLCPATVDGYSGDVAWQTWSDGTESLQIVMWGQDLDSTYEILVDGFSLGNFEADDSGVIWAAFSTNPFFDDEQPLPVEVSPVSGIDVVEIRNAAGELLVAGSFTDPCEMEQVFNSDYTDLCSSVEDYVGGGIGWMTMEINDVQVSQTIFVDFWSIDSGVTYTVEIDGIVAGDLVENPWWEDALGLVIGDGGDVELPAGLDPVNGIDIVRILDENGDEVAAGSFANPCEENDDPGDDNRVGKYSGSSQSTN